MAFHKQPFLSRNLVSILLWTLAKRKMETSNSSNYFPGSLHVVAKAELSYLHASSHREECLAP